MIISLAAQNQILPSAVWDMELWEFNNYIIGAREKQKNDVASAILTGFYCAYYTNGGKKAKSPEELINKLYSKQQALSKGISDIARVKEIERKKYIKEANHESE